MSRKKWVSSTGLPMVVSRVPLLSAVSVAWGMSNGCVRLVVPMTA